MSDKNKDIDLIDFSLSEDRPASKSTKSTGNRPRKKKKLTKKQKALRMVGRIASVLGITLLMTFIWLWGIMKILCDGPSTTARDQFVLSVSETSGIYWLADWYCTKEEIAQIKENNSIKDTDDVTDTNLVQIDTENTDPTIPDIQIIDVKGSTYNGKLMIVKDPSRLFIGTVPTFYEGTGMVVSDIAARYDAIAGVNGGEFVDLGNTAYTAMPVGLVIIDGEVKKGETGVWHVTGITEDHKLVVGNMSAQQALEKNIKYAVNIAYDIGPFLVVNGEAQDVAGVGGGLNPRTAIGQTADGMILLLAIDGRQANSLGASFSDLQDIMLQYGAVNASVMDGGTSTQMYYDGEVINTPYSPTGPRRCPTAFLISK